MKSFFQNIVVGSFTLLFLGPALAFATSPSVSIGPISPSNSVSAGNEIFFSVTPNNFSGTLSYSVSDSFSGTTITNSVINSAGVFAWIPGAGDSGTHTLTITVTDDASNSASASTQITVQGQPTLTLQSLSPGNTISAGATLTFSVSPFGFNSPSYTISDTFGNSSLGSSNINSAGNLSWTPTPEDAGTHSITVTASDSSGHLAVVNQSIYVNSPSSITIKSIATTSSVSVGQTIYFTATTTGFILPVYSVTDSFGGSVSNSNLNSSGNFVWTPSTIDVGTHTITVYASDSAGHSNHASVTIKVNSNISTTTTTTPPPANTNSNTGTNQNPGHVFSVYLYPGLTSSEVTALQQVLVNQGFLTGPITGYYGSLTEKAVKAFQAAHGLSQLGVVGPATRTALNQLSNTAPTTNPSGNQSSYVFTMFLSLGSSGQEVTALQNKLSSLGIYTGPISGYFGALTQAAVKKFQSQHGLSALGYTGPGTRAALNQ